MAKIRLVAADVDGTLLTPEGMLSERTVAAVNAAREAGVRVCPCSGRNHTELKGLYDRMELDEMAVINNGASVIHFHTGEYLIQRRFDSETVRVLLQTILEDAKAFPKAAINTAGGFETHMWRARSTRDMLRRSQGFSNRVGMNGELYFIHDHKQSWLEAAQRDTQRIIYTIEAARHSARIQALLAPLDAVDITTGAGWVELVPKGVHKGDGLAHLCEKLDIPPAQVMAVGDGLNDVGMLGYAGVAVAMGNAHDGLKDIADAVTDGNDADGFAGILERCIREGV